MPAANATHAFLLGMGATALIVTLGVVVSALVYLSRAATPTETAFPEDAGPTTVSPPTPAPLAVPATRPKAVPHAKPSASVADPPSLKPF